MIVFVRLWWGGGTLEWEKVLTGDNGIFLDLCGSVYSSVLFAIRIGEFLFLFVLASYGLMVSLIDIRQYLLLLPLNLAGAILDILFGIWWCVMGVCPWWRNKLIGNTYILLTGKEGWVFF